MSIKRKCILPVRLTLTHRITIVGLLVVIAACSLLCSFPESTSDELDFAPPTQSINTIIDQSGYFLPNPGYKIIQIVRHPMSELLAEFYRYLLREKEVNRYYTLASIYTYHIVLTELKNDSIARTENWIRLKNEQLQLDQARTETECIMDNPLIIDQKEIRLKIQYSNSCIDGYIKSYQKRWNESFPDLIEQHYTSFYMTLAYQRKEIPNKDIISSLENRLKDWTGFPIDEIKLGPIHVCEFTNAILFEPILRETNGALDLTRTSSVNDSSESFEY